MTPATPANPAPPAPAYDWASEFHAFTGFHWLTAGAFTAVILGVCLAGVHRDRRYEALVRLFWTASIIVTQTITTVWYCLPANFDFAVSLPFHVCDLGGWIAVVALLTADWRWRAVLYFWGIGLSTQAFFTPVLSEGYASAQYWFFWIGHTQIVGSAVYEVWVRRYRPGWRDYGAAVIVGVVYVLSMVGFNEIRGTNYGYVGRELPEKKTILHALPPWPWRVLALCALAALAQFLALLPWLIAARRQTEPQAAS
ncbi:MAG: TIGR02206 family membrane protein [Phycisphaerales bacterium JB040]